MCDINGDVCAVWVERNRTARKQHRCCECGAPIPKGHRYLQINSVFDGSASTDRRHIACDDLWQRVSADVCGHPGYSRIGGLLEEITESQESMRAVLPPELLALYPDRRMKLPNPFAEAFWLIRDTYNAFAGVSDAPR